MRRGGSPSVLRHAVDVQLFIVTSSVKRKRKDGLKGAEVEKRSSSRGWVDFMLTRRRFSQRKFIYRCHTFPRTSVCLSAIYVDVSTAQYSSCLYKKLTPRSSRPRKCQCTSWVLNCTARWASKRTKYDGDQTAKWIERDRRRDCVHAALFLSYFPLPRFIFEPGSIFSSLNCVISKQGK